MDRTGIPTAVSHADLRPSEVVQRVPYRAPWEPITPSPPPGEYAPDPRTRYAPTGNEAAIQRQVTGHLRPSERMAENLQRQVGTGEVSGDRAALTATAADWLENTGRAIPGGVASLLTAAARGPETLGTLVLLGKAIVSGDTAAREEYAARLFPHTAEKAGYQPEHRIGQGYGPEAVDRAIQETFQPEGPGGVIGQQAGMLLAGGLAARALEPRGAVPRPPTAPEAVRPVSGAPRPAQTPLQAEFEASGLGGLADALQRQPVETPPIRPETLPGIPERLGTSPHPASELRESDITALNQRMADRRAGIAPPALDEGQSPLRRRSGDVADLGPITPEQKAYAASRAASPVGEPPQQQPPKKGTPEIDYGLSKEEQAPNTGYLRPSDFKELSATERGDRFVTVKNSGQVFDRLYATSITPPGMPHAEAVDLAQRLNASDFNRTDQSASVASYDSPSGRHVLEPTREDAVRKALAEGKPVPPHILADYPDLAPIPPSGKPSVSGGGVLGNERGALGQGGRFYSRLERSIERSKFDRAPAQTWISKLRGQQASAAEFDQALGEALKSDPKRLWTRDELLELAKGRGYGNLSETTLGGKQNVRPTVGLEELPDGRYAAIDKATGKTVHIGADRQSVYDWFDETYGEKNPPKFGQYTEPGGENYREILIQTPEAQSTFDPAKVEIKRHRRSTTQGDTSVWYDGKKVIEYSDDPVLQPDGQYRQRPDSHWMEVARSLYEKGDRINKVPQRGESFQSSHFDQPNVLAHVRLKDRTLPNGERVLFVEEIQSDWHQKGRKQGYDKPAWKVTEANGTTWFNSYTDEAVARREATRIGGTVSRYSVGVPDAPFKETPEWMGLAMKRVIDEAVAGNYDRVAWTTGTQQAKRYDLSKVADEVHYEPTSGKLSVLQNGSTVHTGTYDPKALADVIGKEAADRLLATPVKPFEMGDQPTHSLEGQQLSFGGGGMKAFYDQMLPDWVKGYGKQYGIKIEPASVQTGKEVWQVYDTSPDGGPVGRSWDDRAAAEAHLRRLRHDDPEAAQDYEVGVQNEGLPQGSNNQSFRVTPEMKARIRNEGQSLGAVGADRGKGALPIMGGIAGGVAGGAAGYASGNPDESKGKRLLRAAIGAVGGGILGAAGGRGIEKIGESGDAFRKLLAPASRTSESDLAGNIIRAHTGQAARDFERAREALHAFRKEVRPITDPAGLQFVDAIESGTPQGSPKLTRAAGAIRHVLDTERDAIRGLGKGALDHFIADYFPHIWEDPKQVGKVLAQIESKRPLQGSKSFLKQRTIPTIAEGLQHGLTPVSDNPLDLVLLKLREMRRFRMAHEIMGEMESKGLAKTVAYDAHAPDGYARINDAIARKGSAGQVWAPEPVATVLNNYLSPGLRGNALFDGYMSVGNVLNQAQLGISLFHLGFTSMDAAVSKTALAVEQVAAGRPLQAAKSLASVPAAPLSNYLRGSKLMKAYLVPGSQGVEFAQLADAITQGGGRVRMEGIYKNNAITKLVQAVRRKEFVSAGVHLIPAALEAASKPLMEHIVPRQKLGVFADLARFELSKLKPGHTADEARAVMSKVWDSVDNRMGQLVYDNLFWHRALKDLSMASVRSVGWNLGTIRELGGGLKDVARIPKNIFQGNRALSHRAAYVAALPITVGMAGAITQYLYTGTWPETLKDYFFPRNGQTDDSGNPDRVVLPSYMKDVAAYARHPVTTVEHKLHPLIGLVADMLHNEDYYGDLIRNPDDPFVQQVKQEAAFLGQAVLPFGVQNILEEHKRSGTVAVAPMLGLTPAPREAVRTPAQNRMTEYVKRRIPGGQTPERKDIGDQRRTIYQQVDQGTLTHQEAVTRLVATGMDRSSASSELHQRKTPRLARSFKGLTLEEAERVYADGTPEEQNLWLPILNRKRREARHLVRP